MTAGYPLSLSRFIAAPRRNIWRCWTEPELIKQWFTPRPWTTPVVEMDVRSGGASHMIFRGPEGQEFPNDGVFLEVVPNERLVFTDAYRAGWVPSEKPFMTGVISMKDEGQGTRYDAAVYHWREDDMKSHEQMGFHDGWGKATDQLEVLAKTL